ncbi:unnamed protein product [Amoebophrya sp. A25]|nr:unnamed protein product [Amoebophrya sp. A25]|eukprot:GSA25T00000815001.1
MAFSCSGTSWISGWACIHLLHLTMVAGLRRVTREQREEQSKRLLLRREGQYEWDLVNPNTQGFKVKGAEGTPQVVAPELYKKKGSSISEESGEDLNTCILTITSRDFGVSLSDKLCTYLEKRLTADKPPQKSGRDLVLAVLLASDPQSKGIPEKLKKRVRLAEYAPFEDADGLGSVDTAAFKSLPLASQKVARADDDDDLAIDDEAKEPFEDETAANAEAADNAVKSVPTVNSESHTVYSICLYGFVFLYLGFMVWFQSWSTAWIKQKEDEISQRGGDGDGQKRKSSMSGDKESETEKRPSVEEEKPTTGEGNMPTSAGEEIPPGGSAEQQNNDTPPVETGEQNEGKAEGPAHDDDEDEMARQTAQLLQKSSKIPPVAPAAVASEGEGHEHVIEEGSNEFEDNLQKKQFFPVPAEHEEAKQHLQLLNKAKPKAHHELGFKPGVKGFGSGKNEAKMEDAKDVMLEELAEEFGGAVEGEGADVDEGGTFGLGPDATILRGTYGLGEETSPIAKKPSAFGATGGGSSVLGGGSASVLGGSSALGGGSSALGGGSSALGGGSAALGGGSRALKGGLNIFKTGTTSSVAKGGSGFVANSSALGKSSSALGKSSSAVGVNSSVLGVSASEIGASSSASGLGSSTLGASNLERASNGGNEGKGFGTGFLS